ncbi:MAG TPA: IS200/IS605 family transposase [Longimicrobium sp.]|nr:IS200/IS605 family transposase [Longimicrobium sp.]
MFVHLVWATWDRRPLLAPEIRNRVYRCIQAEAHRLGCEVYAIGGIEDHVHVLVRFVPTVSVAELVKQVKGASSRLVQTEIRAWEFFKWQGSYGAFTIAANQIEPVRRYIHNQAEHHRTGNLYRALERTDAET